METTILTSAGVAIIVLEVIKWIVKKYILKNPNYVFSETFYKVSLAVLNVLAIPLLAFLGVEGAVMPTDWLSFGKLAVVAGLSALVSMFGYDHTLGAMKSNIRWNKILEEDELEEKSVG